MTSANNLLKMITAPTKVAHALDWKKIAGGTILNLEIHKDRIGMAVAAHPSIQSSACMLEPIPVSSPRKISSNTINRLSQVVKDYNVCAFMVSFPLQQDTGKLGAACGRVLYTLENIINGNTADDSTSSSSRNSIFTLSRPLCLWNSLPIEEQPADEWGQNPLFARTSTKPIHCALEEQYRQDEAVVASELWDSFVQVHWPKVYAQKEKYVSQTVLQCPPRQNSSNLSKNWDDEADSDVEKHLEEGNNKMSGKMMYA